MTRNILFALQLLFLMSHLSTCLFGLFQQEKPYICGTCGDTFVTSESLKQHHSLTHVLMVETHRSFDESALHSYQQGTRIDSSPLPKSYNRVHLATQRLCSQGPFSTSFPPMMSNPVQVSALSIHQKQVQYELPSSQAQQYLEMSPYSTGNTGPGLMVPSTLTVLELDSVVSKPWIFSQLTFLSFGTTNICQQQWQYCCCVMAATHSSSISSYCDAGSSSSSSSIYLLWSNDMKEVPNLKFTLTWKRFGVNVWAFGLIDRGLLVGLARAEKVLCISLWPRWWWWRWAEFHWICSWWKEANKNLFIILCL